MITQFFELVLVYDDGTEQSAGVMDQRLADSLGGQATQRRGIGPYHLHSVGNAIVVEPQPDPPGPRAIAYRLIQVP